MENENFDIVAAVKQLVLDYGHLAEEIADVKKTIYDNLIAPIETEFNQMRHDEALSDFRCKHAEKLEGFNDKLKALEGEDFDIFEKAFDDFSAREDGMDEDVYVDKLAAKVSEQLNAIGEAFGVKPEEIEEVKIETKDGEVKADVEDGEVKAIEKETEAETEVETEEAKPETEVAVEPAEPTTDENGFPTDEEENRKYWEKEAEKYR